MLAIALAVVTYGLLLILHRPIIRIALGSEFEDAAGPLLILIIGGFIWMSTAVLLTLPASDGACATPWPLQDLAHQWGDAPSLSAHFLIRFRRATTGSEAGQ